MRRRSLITFLRSTLLIVLGAMTLAGCGDDGPTQVRLMVPRNTVAARLPMASWLWDEWSQPLVRLPEGEIVRLPPQFWNQTPWSEPAVFSSQEDCMRRRAEILSAFAPDEPVRQRLSYSRCVRVSRPTTPPAAAADIVHRTGQLQ